MLRFVGDIITCMACIIDNSSNKGVMVIRSK